MHTSIVIHAYKYTLTHTHIKIQIYISKFFNTYKQIQIMLKHIQYTQALQCAMRGVNCV